MVDTGTTPGGTATILLVEDDAATARHIAAMLVRQGHRVRVARDWLEALRAFDPHEVDLVLMDAVLPGVDGFKLTPLLRARMRAYVPVLFLTGLVDLEERRQGLAAGADDFLVKPVDDAVLRLRVCAMLRIRQLTRVLEEKSAQLDRLAHLDGLTGVGNRHGLERGLRDAWERARRGGRDLCVLMLDLDHFKRVNDALGHRAGDSLLSGFAALLEELIGEPDRVFRYGGEEFVVLCLGRSVRRARNLAERIRRRFEHASPAWTGGTACTVSVGVAGLAPGLAEDPDALIARADAALYRSKHEGRNRVTCAGDPADERECA